MEMQNSSVNISPEPDGVTGMIFAMEGIRGTVVLLNGPMGCRFYHSTTSQFLTIRPMLYVPSGDGEKVPVDYNFLDSWFFRQQRVPCTYLDGYEYVYGTAEKVREGILYMKEHIAFDLLAVINAPGASLIGDQLAELIRELLPDKRCVMLESPGFSTGFDRGYEEACLRLLKQNRAVMKKTRAGGRPRVNVLGLSIWDRYFEGDREEIERLLSMCGMEPGCFLAADCGIEDLHALPDADLNLVLNPQRGRQVAAYLEKEFGTPSYECAGLPIGYAETEKMMRTVASLTGTDPEPVLSESRRSRAYAWYKINGIYQSSGLPKGALFAVSGTFSQVYAYTAFLTEYLGMLPDSAEVQGEMQPSMRRKLEALLADCRCEGALEKPLMKTEAQLVFGDANTIAALMVRPPEDGTNPFCGIEISLPGMGYTDLVRKTHLGLRGALFLTEQVLNGLMTRL